MMPLGLGFRTGLFQDRFSRRDVQTELELFGHDRFHCVSNLVPVRDNYYSGAPLTLGHPLRVSETESPFERADGKLDTCRYWSAPGGQGAAQRANPSEGESRGMKSKSKWDL